VPCSDLIFIPCRFLVNSSVVPSTSTVQQYQCLSKLLKNPLSTHHADLRWALESNGLVASTDVWTPE